MTNKEICYHYLTETAALSRAVAIGIMANIRHESNFSPTAKGDNGTSFGLCQWHKSRWDRLKKYCQDNGHNINDVQAQLHFLLWEFKKYYYYAWDNMCEQPNTPEGAAEVAYIMCVKYEIPANKEQSGKNRGKTALSLWEEFSTGNSGNVENIQAAPVVGVRKAYYRVRTGDTLTKIAADFRLSLGDLLAYNTQITNPDKIVVGEKITIPGRVG